MRVAALLRSQVSMLDHRVWWNGLIWNSLTGQSDLFTNSCNLGPWLPSIGNKQKRIPENVTTYHYPLFIMLDAVSIKTTLNGMNNHEGIVEIVFLLLRKDRYCNLMRRLWSMKSIFYQIREEEKITYSQNILNWQNMTDKHLMTIRCMSILSTGP